MSPVFHSTLLALPLLTPPALAEKPPAPDCLQSRQSVELSPETDRQVSEVCIGPGLSTVFHFDTLLLPGSVQLQGEERFEEVVPGRSSLTLIAPEVVVPGERLGLTLRFADGASPVSAHFVLVGHAETGPRRVDVYRRARPLETCPRELREKDERIARLSAENERLRTQRDEPGWLMSLASAVASNEGSLAVRDLTLKASSLASATHTVHAIFSYRATLKEKLTPKRVRVAVAVDVTNLGSQPWQTARAVLVDSKGREVPGLKLSQEAPIPGAQWGRVVVEAELTEAEAQGTFQLLLEGTGEAQRLTLDGVTFP